MGCSGRVINLYRRKFFLLSSDKDHCLVSQNLCYDRNVALCPGDMEIRLTKSSTCCDGWRLEMSTRHYVMMCDNVTYHITDC